MIKQRVNATFIFLLLTAFMVVKWAPSHAHLNAQHDHGSKRHQHSVEAHAHQSVIFHADQIDSNHMQMDEAKVVDLDHDQSPPNNKKQDNSSPALAAFVYGQLLVQTREPGLPEGRNSPPRLLHQHPAQPRAPPRFS